MTLGLVLLALAVLLVTAAAALLVGRSDRLALAIGSLGALAGSALGGAAVVRALLVRAPVATRAVPWSQPVGRVVVGVDPLSAFFLLCVFLVSGLAALYGWGYLARDVGRRRLGVPAAFFNLLVAAMALVVLARDAVTFLVAWEVMTIASYFLVTYDSVREEVRRAGLTYLVASQIGVIFLFALFLVLGRHAGSLELEAMQSAGAPPGRIATLCFVLALVGFGTKAGFWPVHVWLPDAHPAAPSHVSALMSGVMIKLGLYGLLRVLGLFGAPPAAWGFVLIAVGATSATVGILLALVQRDLKRLLAYSSVENVGVIALGIGLALLGRAHGAATVASLAMSGALLHVLVHGVMKGLLFQAAGSVLHGAGTVDLDALGGLGRRMPLTAATFLVGAVSISALPGGAGFVSEWFVYVAALRGEAALPVTSAVVAVAVVPVLALVGGLASACFVKAFGLTFLGEPRSGEGAHAHEAGRTMRGALIAGAIGCAAVGLLPAVAFALVRPVVESVLGARIAPGTLGSALPALSRAAVTLVGVGIGLTALRGLLLRGRDVRAAPTWGCGYESPSPRMQYTSGSFAQPLVEPLSFLLPHSVQRTGPTGPFPTAATFREQVGDAAGERLLVPAARRLLRLLGRVRVIQHGRLHLYLVYILVTLIALLVWQLGTP